MNGSTGELLREVTQSILALMVVAGAGYALVFVPTGHNDAISSALGMVLGWYFAKSVIASSTRLSGHQ
jgi:hypothetical protein